MLAAITKKQALFQTKPLQLSAIQFNKTVQESQIKAKMEEFRVRSKILSLKKTMSLKN
jgi:hypothetical protein